MSPWFKPVHVLAGYALGEMAVGLNTVGVETTGGAFPTHRSARRASSETFPTWRTKARSNRRSTTIRTMRRLRRSARPTPVSLQEMNFSSHFTGGLAQCGAITAAVGAKDAYNRTFGLVSYSTAPNYSIIGMALIGHDSNPNDGPGDSASNGWSFEGIGSPTPWLHLDGRYERTNDGLGGIANNYVGDIAFSIMPNLTVTLRTPQPSADRRSRAIKFCGVPRSTGPRTLRRPSQPRPVHLRPRHPPPGRPQHRRRRMTSHSDSKSSARTVPPVMGPTVRVESAEPSRDCSEANARPDHRLHRKASGAMPKYYPSVISAAQVHAVADYIRETFK